MYFCVFYHSSCLRDSSDCVMNMRRCLHLRVESPGWWMNSETNWISWCVLNLTSLWRWSSVRWSILTETQDQDHSTDRRRAVGLCCPSVIRWSRAGTLNQNHFLICAVSVTEADSGSADGNNSPADTRPTLKMHRGLQCVCVCDFCRCYFLSAHRVITADQWSAGVCTVERSWSFLSSKTLWWCMKRSCN